MIADSGCAAECERGRSHGRGAVEVYTRAEEAGQSRNGWRGGIQNDEEKLEEAYTGAISVRA